VEGLAWQPVRRQHNVEDSRRSTGIEESHRRLAELWSYLTANQTRLINYTRAYREGHRISTARVESTVHQPVDWRMAKKQYMRWIKRGTQILLHTCCALLNGELSNYTGRAPSESSSVLAVAA
jgi:transposase InsO family protein